jgi:hypothetical protein
VKIIVAGTIGRSGLGGQAWASLQYLLGFRALGHEVFYLEDCGQSSWVYNWDKSEWTTDLDYPAAYVSACLAPFGFNDRWTYCTDEGLRGAPLEQLQDFCARTDLLLMRAVPLWVWRKEYAWPRRRAFIDVDPGFTQISIANGDKGLAEGIAHCERRFTVGQNIGMPHCPAPQAGGPWLTTLPPIFLPEWPLAECDATDFTAVVRGQGFKEVTYNGVTYGQRDAEFPKFQDLPRRTGQRFLLAQMGIDPKALAAHGWKVAPGEAISKTPGSYREFIQQSRAELGIPKHGYVKMQSGWFSDRSVCYLASGRPVVIEDTKLASTIPVGDGLLTFDSVESAVSAIDAVNRDYHKHRQSARRLAEEIFSTEKVLPKLLTQALG